MQDRARNSAVPNDVEPIDCGHRPLADHVAIGVVVALPLVDKSPLKTEIGDTQRLVGADGVPGLDNPDAVDRPFAF